MSETIGTSDTATTTCVDYLGEISSSTSTPTPAREGSPTGEKVARAMMETTKQSTCFISSIGLSVKFEVRVSVRPA